MSSPESKTCPAVVTTSRGIGGAWRNISVPTQPRTPNEHTKMAMKTIQSFFTTSHSSRIGFSYRIYSLLDYPRRLKCGVDTLLQLFVTLRVHAAAVDEETGRAFQSQFYSVINIGLDHLGKLF